MHHISRRHGFRSSSAKRRRTVSRDSPSCAVSLTIASARRSRVQRLRSGGLEQAVATSKAVSLPDSLRGALGRVSSLSASSRLPSTQRRLVRHTVDPPTETLLAITSSLTPASAASRSSAFEGSHKSCNGFSPGLHAQAGTVSRVHPRIHAGERAAAGAGRYPTILSADPTIGSSNAAGARTGQVDLTPDRQEASPFWSIAASYPRWIPVMFNRPKSLGRGT